MSSDYERELVSMFLDKQWVAHRTAGSQGDAGDVTALKQGDPPIALIIEEKSTKKPLYSFKERTKIYEQWHDLVDLHERGYDVVVAVRHKRGSVKNRWQMHPVGDLLETDYPHICRREEGTNFEDFIEEKTHESRG